MNSIWQMKKLSLREKKWQSQYSNLGEPCYKPSALHCHSMLSLLKILPLVSFWGAQAHIHNSVSLAVCFIYENSKENFIYRMSLKKG